MSKTPYEYNTGNGVRLSKDYLKTLCLISISDSHYKSCIREGRYQAAIDHITLVAASGLFYYADLNRTHRVRLALELETKGRLCP